MKLFFGSVSWAPTWIESCVMDEGWARVTCGTVIEACRASCDHAVRDQVPRVAWKTTAVPATITVTTFEKRWKHDRTVFVFPTLTLPRPLMPCIVPPHLSTHRTQSNRGSIGIHANEGH